MTEHNKGNELLLYHAVVLVNSR